MPRIVHLGLGNFHRAHQAWYTSVAGGWDITGVIISNRKLRDQLASNNNDYTLGIWGKEGLRTKTLSVYDDVLMASEQSKEIISKIADGETHIVTMTVTEKGYYLLSENNHLNRNAPPIKKDLSSETPTTAIGLLGAGIAQRAINGVGPLTVLSCDNLAENGSKLQQVMCDYLMVKYPGAVEWMSQNATFPNSMVDRITPRLSADAIAEINAVSNTHDTPIVGTEDFSEWIIADKFISPRPDWESAGVIFVPEVASFEDRKLRLLNASHSFLAYAGQLAGYRYVHEAIADDKLKRYVNALWDEAAVTVTGPAADTLDQYRTALLDRFSVKQMRHDLSQIAMDGSVKLRERLIPVLLDRAHQKLASPHTCRAIAAWFTYIQQSIQAGVEPNDPQADYLMNAVNNSLNSEQCYKKLAQLIGLPEEWLSQVSSYQTALI